MFHHSSTNAEFAPACGVRYLLIDGTAAYEVLCKLDVFKEGADWFRSLALHPSMELAAPMLVDPEMAVAQGRKHTLERVMRAYPLQLHCSQIHSPYSMDELAPHIMQFMSFVDSFNSRYILQPC